MTGVFAFLVALTVPLVLVLGIGIGVGLFLEWLLTIERGLAVLTGVIATAFAVHLLVRLVSAPPEDESSEPSAMIVPDVVITPLWRPRRTRKRKS